MKTYLVDTNFILRYLLHDNEDKFAVTLKVFNKVKRGEHQIKVISEIIPELVYVLSKVYKVPREEIYITIVNFIKSDNILVEKLDIWLKSLEVYSQTNIDIIDIFLYIQSKVSENQVLTFDKDFKKLKTLIN
jgi:predicted nucleic-acid-binding protein